MAQKAAPYSRDGVGSLCEQMPRRSVQLWSGWGAGRGGGEEQSKLDETVSVGQAKKLGFILWVEVFREFMRRVGWK